MMGGTFEGEMMMGGWDDGKQLFGQKREDNFIICLIALIASTVGEIYNCLSS